MIKQLENYYVINTKELSYVFHINEIGYVVHDYFGNKLDDNQDLKVLGVKEDFPKGTMTVLDSNLNTFCADDNLSEISFSQKGDYKEPGLLIKNKVNGYTFDFRFNKYEVIKNPAELEELPSPHEIDEDLVITLKDESSEIYLELHYLVCNNYDVISRYSKIINKTNDELEVLKIVSMQLDLVNNNYELMNLNGGWISETHKETQEIHRGIYINDSKTGNSSGRHNPFFLIKNKNTLQDYGECYGFNLMYSGNHQELVELTSYNHLHLQSGINPHLFNYVLKANEEFTTPVALLSYSSVGLNKLSNRMHEYINEHVTNKEFRGSTRPILINNWEGTYFRFNESKLLSIARTAKKFGVELFVLDDGWFGTRNDDTQALGDYDVNKKKLPHDIQGLAKRINKLGLKFGLWFEPEAINPNSKLYKIHPDWAITTKNIKPSLGRNELLLDLSKEEVQNYIIDNISKILDRANIEYIKWDMNRSMSDIRFDDFDAGEFIHRYYLGLYKVLRTLTKKYPHVLFENCASGGNRLDLGIMHYFPQTWASDCSDPYERISIQEGLSYGYPQLCYTAHVSHHRNHQTLRDTTYNTKFCVASMAVLGYELMLNELTPIEKKEVKQQIAFYKEHRELIQFGDFYRIKTKEFEGDNAMFQIISKDRKESIIGYFNGLQSTTPKETILKGYEFKDDVKYLVSVYNTKHHLDQFGNLINMVLPLHINSDGILVPLINKYFGMDAEKEEYAVSGKLLKDGLILKCEWAGNGYNENVRVLGDFGSRLYYIREI